MGDGAKPFSLSFPQSAPNSVFIKGEDGDASEMGVSYHVKLHMGDSSEDYVGTKKATVTMSIRKVMRKVSNLRNSYVYFNQAQYSSVPNKREIQKIVLEGKFHKM